MRFNFAFNVGNDMAEVNYNNLVVKGFFQNMRPERAAYLVNFSERYRYMYVETPKVGCSTVKKTLQALELRGTGKEIARDTHDRKLSPLLAPAAAIGSFVSGMTDKDWIRFSFVRNPYTRILSCYLDKFVTAIARPMFNRALGFPEAHMVTFPEFLQAVRRQPYLDMDIHWLPQSVILEGMRASSFIGRFERFEQDFTIVLREILRDDEPMEILTRNHHAQGAANLVRDHIGAQEAALIREIYRDDFEKYGYSTDPRFA